MAFFKKLKDKLFKSSSKIDEGLEAIVDDGGVAETIDVNPPAAPAPQDRQVSPSAEAPAQADSEPPAFDTFDDHAPTSQPPQKSGDRKVSE